jgi:TRAP-type C4-dicarboxylate transport system permease large subunit
LVAVAVTTTFVPTQIVEPTLEEITTDGVTVALVRVITLLFAVGVVKHGVALEVITTEMVLPLAGEFNV